MVSLLVVAVVTPASSGLADDSGEAGVEVPESVTVETEEIHPLPEVSAVTINTIKKKLYMVVSAISNLSKKIHFYQFYQFLSVLFKLNICFQYVCVERKELMLKDQLFYFYFLLLLC